MRDRILSKRGCGRDDNPWVIAIDRDMASLWRCWTRPSRTWRCRTCGKPVGPDKTIDGVADVVPGSMPSCCRVGMVSGDRAGILLSFTLTAWRFFGALFLCGPGPRWAFWWFSDFARAWVGGEGLQPSEAAIERYISYGRSGYGVCGVWARVVVAPTIGPVAGAVDHRQFFPGRLDFLHQRASGNLSLMLTNFLVSEPAVNEKSKT